MCCLTSWPFFANHCKKKNLPATVQHKKTNKQCKHVCKHCDHCDHWWQQNQPESKTREKVTLDSLDSFRQWGFSPWFIYLFICGLPIYFHSHCVCLFAINIMGIYASPHSRRLSFLLAAPAPSPSRYLCISTSRPSPPRGWKALPSLVNPPPFSKCTKGFLSACLHSGAEGVLSLVQK